MSGTASSSTAVMATPGFNTGRTLPSLANFDFAIVGTAASDCAWPKVPDANMALSLDTVPASPPDACVTDHHYLGIPWMSPELAWMVAIFWIGRKFRCGQRGSWLISWFFISRWLADGSFRNSKEVAAFQRRRRGRICQSLVD